MQRMDTVITQMAMLKRAELIAGDTNTDPTLRYDRAEVTPGCLLKPGDDVEVSQVVARVVCPADTDGWFYAYTIDGTLFVLTQFEAQYVTDRAPADPEETPMPIFAS